MSDPNQPSAPPGWYPDGQGGQRWWDGAQWTDHAQQVASDRPQQPPAAPAAPPGPGSDLPTVVVPSGHQPPPGAPPALPPYGIPVIPPPSSTHNKRVLIIVGAVVGFLVLLGAVAGVLIAVLGTTGPDDVARSYVQAFSEGNFKKACELMSHDYQKQVLASVGASSCTDLGDKVESQQNDAYERSYGDSYDHLHAATQWTYDVVSTDRKGDKKATVTISATGTYNGDNTKYRDDRFDGSTTKSVSFKLEMVKEGGDWKVADDTDA